VTVALTSLDVMCIYSGSDGNATRDLYAHLKTFGATGEIAINLFRAQKCSERAKVYRGGGYRGAAFERKQWSIDNLCKALTEHAATLGFGWGWGLDDKTPHFPHVLYVELPTGQVSFHSPVRGLGPDYPRGWDGIPNQSVDRIVRWIGRVLEGPA